MGFDSTIETLEHGSQIKFTAIQNVYQYDHGIATTNYQNKRWFELYELGDSICDFSEAEKFSVQVYWKLFPIPRAE